jgi:hypothetical protein
MTVKIYLRSIVYEGGKHLAMFDSNRSGDIDNLQTNVEPGDTIIWKPDFNSGIKRITGIYSKNGERIIFETDPKKQLFCGGFEFKVPKNAPRGIEEAYSIEYILCDDTKGILDPYIRIPPPPTIR